MTCSSCSSPLTHLAGHAVIRLYRCEKCGQQLMVPGNPNEPEVAPPPPAPEKKGFLARIFGG
jgi:DNA-directed RNA polymerase subunit RPC12/RpoP